MIRQTATLLAQARRTGRPLPAVAIPDEDTAYPVPRPGSMPAAQPCKVTIGDGLPSHFTGTHSLGDPVTVLRASLRCATRDGTLLPGGHGRHDRHLVRAASGAGGRPG